MNFQCPIIFIHRLSNNMKIAVRKNHLMGYFLDRNPNPVKNTRKLQTFIKIFSLTLALKIYYFL